jgi:hypothetical protein
MGNLLPFFQPEMPLSGSRHFSCSVKHSKKPFIAAASKTGTDLSIPRTFT